MLNRLGALVGRRETNLRLAVRAVLISALIAIVVVVFTTDNAGARVLGRAVLTEDEDGGGVSAVVGLVAFAGASALWWWVLRPAFWRLYRKRCPSCNKMAMRRHASHTDTREYVCEGCGKGKHFPRMKPGPKGWESHH